MIRSNNISNFQSGASDSSSARPSSIPVGGPATQAVEQLGKDLGADVSYWSGASHETQEGVTSGFGRYFGDFLNAVDEFGESQIESVWQNVESGGAQHHPRPMATVDVHTGFPHESGSDTDDFSLPSDFTPATGESQLDDGSVNSNDGETYPELQPEIQGDLSTIPVSALPDHYADQIAAAREARLASVPGSYEPK